MNFSNEESPVSELSRLWIYSIQSLNPPQRQREFIYRLSKKAENVYATAPLRTFCYSFWQELSCHISPRETVLLAFLIVLVGLTPSIVSIFVLRRANAQSQARFHLMLEAVAARGLHLSFPEDQHYVEAMGYIVGDQSCAFNARSPYLRCAVNPVGPCTGCRHYQSREGGICSG